jgi:hypothetical protein
MIKDVPVWLHGNWDLRSQTVYWSGSDTRDQFEKNISNPQKLKLLKNLGLDTPESITYTYNKHGFRDQEFDDRPCGIALGCSFTEGVGLPAQDSWPTKLSEMLGTHVWNLGVGGGATDTAFTLLDYYIEQLSPSFVAMCVPPMARFEYYSNNIAHRVMFESWFIPAPAYSFFKEWFATDLNSQINRRKNLLAIEQLCVQKNIPFYVLHSDQDLKFDASARDLFHPGQKSIHDFTLKMHNKITNRENS